MNLVCFLFIILASVSASFISTHSRPIIGELKFVVNASSEQEAKSKSLKILRYLYGNLASYNSGFDESRIEVVISNRSNEIDFTVAAKVLIAWPTEAELPEQIKIFLPSNVENEFIREALKIYEKKCTYKINGSIDSYYAYIRPFLPNCEIQTSNPYFFPVEVVLKPIPLESNSKHSRFLGPPLKKQKGIVFFGKENPFFSVDASAIEFNQVVDWLVSKWSGRIVNRLYFDSGVLISLLFENSVSIEAIDLFLADNPSEMDIEYQKQFLNSVRNSDFFFYSGHAGMGKVIDKFSNDVLPLLNNSSVVMFNSCHTMGYTVRPSDLRHSYILNATQNYFGTFFQTNAKMLEMIFTERPLSEALPFLPKYQRTIIFN